jgi:NAD(P)H-dependent FMN reductase
MTDSLRIAVVLGTIREGRFGEIPASWVAQQANAHSGMVADIVDLRDYRLPLFGDAAGPDKGDTGATERWQRDMDAFDGYVFVTAEYNHSISSPLKNALDYLGPQLHRKPAAFVGYGGVGSARAVEHLRHILVEFQMAPLRNATHIGMEQYLAVSQRQAALNDFDFLNERATTMLDELAWWAKVLREGREGPTAGEAAS